MGQVEGKGCACFHFTHVCLHITISISVNMIMNRAAMLGSVRSLHIRRTSAAGAHKLVAALSNSSYAVNLLHHGVLHDRHKSRYPRYADQCMPSSS